MKKFCIGPCKASGFTLYELLLVISIIGLTAILGILSVSQIRADSRDAKRKADLAAIGAAQELFFNDNNYFYQYSKADFIDKVAAKTRFQSLLSVFFNATALAVSMGVQSACSNEELGCTHAYPPNIGKYLDPLPADPINNSTHFYRLIVTNNREYCVIANKLERRNASYYISNKGKGYAPAEITACP